MAATTVELASAAPATTPPSPFHCPISLDLMTDPVTLSTGITYDRASIQHWLASGHSTCPVTRQPLDPSTPFFIPNHTLLRIIRTWCDANLPTAGLPAQQTRSSSGIRLGEFCTAALYELRIITPHAASLVTPHQNAIPLNQAASLLAALLSHYSSQACQGQTLAVRTCEEAVATLSLLHLTSHDLTALAQPEVVHCLLCLLHSIERQARLKSAYLLAKLLISQHPTQIKPFLRTLASHLPALAHGLVQILKHSDPSKFLAQDILDCLCLLCRSSRTARLNLTEAPAGLLHVILEQLLQSGRRGAPESTIVISDKALSLLEILASCAEGRAAIASHAFAVPTIAKALYRNASEVATESAVVVLWKMCRYSGDVDRVRRQAMEASVPSKLMLLLQATHCSARAKLKATALLRLLSGEACRHS